MRITLTALAMFAIAAVTSLSVAAAQGPYGGQNLPAGVNSLSVEGQKLSLVDKPTITERQPTIAGTLDRTGGTVQIGVASQAPQTQTVAVSAAGAFSLKLSQPLELGEHEVFIDGQRAGAFVIVATQQPRPPATGTGSDDGNGAQTWLIAGAALAVLAAAAGAGLRFRSRRG
jgi:hypothetical protein